MNHGTRVTEQRLVDIKFHCCHLTVRSDAEQSMTGPRASFLAIRVYRDFSGLFVRPRHSISRPCAFTPRETK